MPKIIIQAVQIEPGNLFFYSLDVLLRAAKESKVGFDEWDVCRHDDLFWLGEQGYLDESDVLQVPLLDILEKRGREYVEWGAEEVLLFIGRDWSGAFNWFLLNKEEYGKREEILAQVPLYS